VFGFMNIASLRSKLSAGGTSVGCFLGLGSPAVAELLALVGFDWLMVEMEHNGVDWADVQNMLMAMNGANQSVLVRVPSSNPLEIQRAVDLGADGVMVPMIRNADEARRCVQATRYPPQGTRGFGGLRASRYTLMNVDYFSRTVHDLFVVLIIETKEAIDNIEAIAAEPHVDALMIGAFDLYLSLGLDPLQQPQEPGEEAIARVVSAAQKHGRVVGCAAGSVTEFQKRCAQGVQMLATSDYSLLIKAAQSTVSALAGDA
jgi:2-keto-3-deoxy-L-rhamnonate aldolase RhmA